MSTTITDLRADTVASAIAAGMRPEGYLRGKYRDSLTQAECKLIAHAVATGKQLVPAEIQARLNTKLGVPPVAQRAFSRRNRSSSAAIPDGYNVPLWLTVNPFEAEGISVREWLKSPNPTSPDKHIAYWSGDQWYTHEFVSKYLVSSGTMHQHVTLDPALAWPRPARAPRAATTGRTATPQPSTPTQPTQKAQTPMPQPTPQNIAPQATTIHPGFSPTRAAGKTEAELIVFTHEEGDYLEMAEGWIDNQVKHWFTYLNCLDQEPSSDENPPNMNGGEDATEYMQRITEYTERLQSIAGKIAACRDRHSKRREEEQIALSVLAEYNAEKLRLEEEERQKLAAAKRAKKLGNIAQKPLEWATTAAGLPELDGLTIPAIDPLFSPPADMLKIWHGLSYQMATEGRASNLLMTGDPGTGKTKTAREFAAHLGIRYIAIETYNYRESRELFATKEASKDQGTHWRKTTLWEAIEKGYCVVAWEELSRARGEVQNGLLPLMDNRRQLFLDGVGTLTVGPCVFFFSSANLKGVDSGIGGIGEALQNRMSLNYEVDHMTTTATYKYLRARAGLYAPAPAKSAIDLSRWEPNGIDDKTVYTICRLAEESRNKAKARNTALKVGASTRLLEAAVEWFNLIGPDALTHAILSHFRDTGSNGERDVMRAILAQVIHEEPPTE